MIENRIRGLAAHVFTCLLLATTLGANGQVYVNQEVLSDPSIVDPILGSESNAKLTLHQQKTIALHGLGTESSRDIYVDQHGAAYVAGSVNGRSEFLTAVFEASGAERWSASRRLNESLAIGGAKLHLDDEGRIVVAGNIRTGNNIELITMVYSPAGEVIWERRSPTDGDGTGVIGIDTDEQGAVYVSYGSSNSTGTERKTLKYTSYEKPDTYMYGSNGDAICAANELIIKFDPALINTARINEVGYEAGPLHEFVPMSVVIKIANALGNSAEPNSILGYKIYRDLTTKHTTSISRLGERVSVPAFWSTLLVSDPAISEPLEAASRVSKVREVFYAEANHIFQLNGKPNDLHLNAELQPNILPSVQHPDADINADQAWDMETGQDFIKVGVVDDGIYYQHRDFERPAPLLPKCFLGWDLVHNGGAASWHPEKNHGTAVAGIIGAIRNNDIGIAGIAGGDASIGNYGSEIYSLDVSGDGLNVSATNAMQALAKGCIDVNSSTLPFAVGTGYGLHVMNNSWGGKSINTGIQEQVYSCFRNQVVVTASKGNTNTVGSVASLSYPADLDSNWVLTVGGSGNNGSWVSGFNGSNNAWQANFGGHLDVVAPATEDLVMSTVRNPTDFSPPLPQPNCTSLFPEYACFDGLSAATPHVSGVAALMLSHHNSVLPNPNDLAPEDVERIIEKTATDVGAPGYDAWNGHGRLNAGKALELISVPYQVVHPSDAPISITQQQGSTQQIQLYPYDSGLSPGWYNAYPVAVTHRYLDQFSPATIVMDVWSRTSSTVGIGMANSNGQLFEWATQEITNAVLNGNEAALTIETTCWFVIEDNNGVPVNKWIPAAPTDLRTTYTLHLNTAGSVGINESVDDGNALSVYPNPAVDQITLKWSGAEEALRVEVYDAFGKLVHLVSSALGKNQELSIPVKQFSSGQYLVRLRTNSSSYAQKFLKR